MLIGIAGGLVGGFFGSAVGLGRVDWGGLGRLALALGGALLLLFAYRKLKKPDAGASGEK